MIDEGTTGWIRTTTTTTTQGMVERDHWKELLRELDDLLCDIVSGDQGSFEPDPGTVSMGYLALDRLRTAYPVSEQLRDAGVPEP